MNNFASMMSKVDYQPRSRSNSFEIYDTRFMWFRHFTRAMQDGIWQNIPQQGRGSACNFSGDPSRDAWGSDRNKFMIVIPPEAIQDFMDKGVNVKQTRPRPGEEEGFEPTYFVTVNVNPYSVVYQAEGGNPSSVYPPSVDIICGPNKHLLFGLPEENRNQEVKNAIFANHESLFQYIASPDDMDPSNLNILDQAFDRNGFVDNAIRYIKMNPRFNRRTGNTSLYLEELCVELKPDYM